DGSYELKNVPCQSGRLHAEAPDFVTLDEQYTPLCGTVNEREILLQPQPSKITGTVRDIPTALLLAGIEVNRGTEKQKTATDGSFTFSDVGCASMTLTVNARGYKPWRKDLTPACGGTTRVDVALEPDLTALFLTVRSVGGGSVQANVTLGALTATTNARGLLALTSIPCAAVRMKVSASGYRTVERAYSPLCDATDLQIVELEPYVTTIHGRVTHHVSGQPVAATVTIDNHAVTTSDGDYDITASCGATVLTVTANGYRSAKVKFTPECGGDNTLDFPMLPLSGGTSVCGTVESLFPLNELGIEGAKITLGTNTTVTERYGTYCLPAVPSCGTTVSMTASKAGYKDSLKKNVQVTCGGLTTVDFLMSDQHIEGRITDGSTGEPQVPIAGAEVTLNGQTVTSGARGQFRFNKMCGPGLMTVKAPGYHSTSRQINPICTNVEPRADVSLQPNATNVVVRLTEGTKGIDDLVVLWGAMPAILAGDGWYTFPNVLCQSAPLTVFSTRYAPERIPVRATCNVTSGHLHGLTRIRTAMRVSVRDGINGGPLVDATVRWRDMTARSDIHGFAFMLDALCGPGTLTIGKQGYPTKDVSINVNCSEVLYQPAEITVR
ncbi:MAG TPA: carboxypeptidase regulatory-like domain-containing protein, partial [Thermoanaerobaculia bacterium]